MPVMLPPEWNAILLWNEIGRKFNNAMIGHMRHANKFEPPQFPARRVPLPANLLAACETFGVLRSGDGENCRRYVARSPRSVAAVQDRGPFR
jgi:hypothetical protein